MAPLSSIPYPLPHSDQPSVEWVDTLGFSVFLVSAATCLGKASLASDLSNLCLTISKCHRALCAVSYFRLSLDGGVLVSLYSHSNHFEKLTLSLSQVAHSWNRMDYIGIVVLISGTFVPATRYGFFCDPHLRNFYTFLIYVASAGKLLHQAQDYNSTHTTCVPQLRSWSLSPRMLGHLRFGASGLGSSSHSVFPRSFQSVMRSIDTA